MKGEKKGLSAVLFVTVTHGNGNPEQTPTQTEIDGHRG